MILDRFVSSALTSRQWFRDASTPVRLASSTAVIALATTALVYTVYAPSPAGDKATFSALLTLMLSLGLWGFRYARGALGAATAIAVVALLWAAFLTIVALPELGCFSADTSRCTATSVAANTVSGLLLPVLLVITFAPLLLLYRVATFLCHRLNRRH